MACRRLRARPLTPGLAAHGAQEAKAKLDAFLEGLKAKLAEKQAESAEPGTPLKDITFAIVMCKQLREAVSAGRLQLNALLPAAEATEGIEGRKAGELPVFVELLHHGALKWNAWPLRQMLKLGADPNIRFRSSGSRVTPFLYVAELFEDLKRIFLRAAAEFMRSEDGDAKAMDATDIPTGELVAALRKLKSFGADEKAQPEPDESSTGAA